MIHVTFYSHMLKFQGLTYNVFIFTTDWNQSLFSFSVLKFLLLSRHEKVCLETGIAYTGFLMATIIVFSSELVLKNLPLLFFLIQNWKHTTEVFFFLLFPLNIFPGLYKYSLKYSFQCPLHINSMALLFSSFLH